jgi:transposase
VICVDEFGPLELRPYAGRSWQRKRKPKRFPATYSRPHGIRNFYGAYEVGTGKLWGHFTRRKRSRDLLTFLKAVRRRYTGRIWIVLDNLSAHKTREVTAYAQRNNIRFQFTPTNASWLNRIERQFTHLKKNVLTHCDYESFDEMRIAIHKYLRWRNNNI